MYILYILYLLYIHVPWYCRTVVVYLVYVVYVVYILAQASDGRPFQGPLDFVVRLEEAMQQQSESRAALRGRSVRKASNGTCNASARTELRHTGWLTMLLARIDKKIVIASMCRIKDMFVNIVNKNMAMSFLFVNKNSIMRDPTEKLLPENPKPPQLQSLQNMNYAIYIYYKITFFESFHFSKNPNVFWHFGVFYMIIRYF